MLFISSLVYDFHGPDVNSGLGKVRNLVGTAICNLVLKRQSWRLLTGERGTTEVAKMANCHIPNGNKSERNKF